MTEQTEPAVKSKTAMKVLKQRALNTLRKWREEGMADEVYSLARLAESLGCTELDLYDCDHDSGAIFELSRSGEVGLTLDAKHCWPQGGRYEWD